MDEGILPFPCPFQGLLQFLPRELQMVSQVNLDLCHQTLEFMMEVNLCLEDQQAATTYQHQFEQAVAFLIGFHSSNFWSLLHQL